MAKPDSIRNATLQILLDRRDSLQDALDATDDGDQARALTVEIRRVRNLLSQYCGRSDPSRDMYLQ